MAVWRRRGSRSPLSLARSFGAASRWQGPGTDRLSQRDGGAHAAHSTLGSCRPPGPAPPTGERRGGGGKEEGGREGGSARAARRGHHVTRGRVTPRAPPCQRRPRPRGGEMAGLTPPARQSPAGLGRVLGSAVASLSRWVGSRVWTEPGGSAAPPLEGGRSSCGVVGVAGAACAGTAWLGSARLGSVRRVRGRAGHASGAGSCGALARERHPLPCSHLKIGGFLIPCNRVLQVAQSTR